PHSVWPETALLSFDSLLLLAQSLGEQIIAPSLGQTARPADIEILIVSNGVQQVIGDELLSPEKATLLGPCRVIPQEYPNIKCRSIDIVLRDSEETDRLLDQLQREIRSGSDEPVVAYRG